VTCLQISVAASKQ